MKDRIPTLIYPARTAATVCVVIASLASGCATAPTPVAAPAAQIEVQQETGFTITEDVPVDETVRAEYDTALRYLEQGYLEEGVTLLEAIVEAAPDLAAPSVDLGIALHTEGRLEDAEASFKRALVTIPSHPIALNELGIIYRKTGRFDAARQSYEAALAVYPGYHYARRNLAILCDLYLADLACALENYQAYMATVPSDDEAEMWIADLRLRMDTGEE